MQIIEIDLGNRKLVGILETWTKTTVVIRELKPDDKLTYILEKSIKKWKVLR